MPDAAPITTAPAPSLRARALRGTLWLLLGNGASQGLRLVSNLILSRLLFPEAFGLMAIVNLVTNGLQMISNVGIRPAIIRHPLGDRRDFLDTAWTLQISRGALLALLALVSAIPIARFYAEPQLAALIAVAAIVPLIDGFGSTKLMSLTRQLDLRGTVTVALAAKSLSIVAMVAFALWYRSVWALVVGAIVSALIQVVLSHWLLPGERDHLRYDREHAREILGFGQWILVSTLFGFLAQRIDVVLLGRLVPMEVLGVYSIGLMLTTVPQRLFGQVTQAVLMPALSESHRAEGGSLQAALLQAKRVLLPLGALGLLAGVAIAPAFFHYLYDERYVDAGWIAQLALLALWFGLLHDTNGRALLALGDSRSWAASNALRTLAAAGACLLGFRLAGLPGVLLALSASAMVGIAAVALALRRGGIRIGTTDLAVTAAGLASGALCTLLPHALAPRLGLGVPLTSALFGALLVLPPAVWVAVRHRDLLVRS